MLTANEARQKSDSLIAEAIKFELESLEILINKEIEKGNKSLYLTVSINAKATTHLRQLGYKVTFDQQDDGCNVSWE